MKLFLFKLTWWYLGRKDIIDFLLYFAFLGVIVFIAASVAAQ